MEFVKIILFIGIFLLFFIGAKSLKRGIQTQDKTHSFNFMALGLFSFVSGTVMLMIWEDILNV